MPNSHSVKTQERILGAAVDLFSKLGYNGISTRDIARKAEVNEVTIYRYFPRKRELFLAALEAELSRINVTGDWAARLASAPDARTAIGHIFAAIDETVRQQPALARLIQFGALELQEDLEPIYRKHLGSLVDLSVSALQRWVDIGQLQCQDPRAVVLAFAATVIGVDTFFPVLWKGDQVAAAEVPGAYAQIWHAALAAKLS